MPLAVMKRFILILALGFGLIFSADAAGKPLSISIFKADVTPPIGSPLCFGAIKPAAAIEERLTARGIVLFGKGKPIVLCVADFVVIANASHDRWKEALAKAAGTTVDRVSMHVIHNHDSPGYDASAMGELDKVDLADVMNRRAAHDKAISDTAAAVRESVKKNTPVTHVGFGNGIVKKFASNRRIIGDNGRIKIGRMSSTRNPKAIAAPEGVIDPELNLVTFWNGDSAIVALSFYASHPQSYYGRGGITPDTVGLARNRRSGDTGAMHIHFDGAGGNIAAGKYNNGSPEARAALTDRMEEGMKAAWDAQDKTAVASEDIEWMASPTQLPWNGPFDEEQLATILKNPDAKAKDRVRAARDLVYYRLWKEGRKININCLRIGEGRLLFFPGELFVEYQLAAKALRPDQFTALAAYGDGGPGYIGTAISYEQGGYEVSRVSRTGPSVEAILTEVTKKLLDVR